MQFNKVLGLADRDKEDPELRKVIRTCEDKLSIAFAELSLNYTNRGGPSEIGGDPFIFQLIYPMRHVCDLSHHYLDEAQRKVEAIKQRIERKEEVGAEELTTAETELKTLRKSLGGRVLTTAATNGHTIFYSPVFINKLTRTGVRIVLMHEALHGALMHPSRTGSRMHRLWNIAIDMKVDFLIIEDLKARKIDSHENVFRKNLGDFITMEEQAQWLRDPFNPPPKLAHCNPMHGLKKQLDPGYADPNDVERPPLYYAEPNLVDDMRRPENIYSYLLAQIPKCTVCGRLGKYKKPDEYRALEKQLEDKQAAEKAACDGKCDGKHCHEDHSHSEDHNIHECDASCVDPCDKKECDCEKGGSGGEYMDMPSDIGTTMDDHMDADVTEDEYAKKLHDAWQTAKSQGGHIGAGLEDEIEQLISPKLSYRDFIRGKLRKAEEGHGGKADWSRPKIKPLFGGLYTPRRIRNTIHFGIIVDTSGSMSMDDCALALSQLTAMNESGSGYCASFDTVFYPDSVVKLRSAKPDEVRRFKCVGRGGTSLVQPLATYQKHMPKLNLLIIASDGGWVESDAEVNEALTSVPKDTEVMFLLTSPKPGFKPNRGRVFQLTD